MQGGRAVVPTLRGVEGWGPRLFAARDQRTATRRPRSQPAASIVILSEAKDLLSFIY